MEAYRLKHIPTGLYYQPSKAGNNLSKRGKVYLTKANPLTMDRGADYIWIDVKVKSEVWRDYEGMLGDLKKCSYNGNIMPGRISKTEFKIEYIENVKQ